MKEASYSYQSCDIDNGSTTKSFLLEYHLPFEKVVALNECLPGNARQSSCGCFRHFWGYSIKISSKA
uniref:Uncharacterized protein n=1 Tax=Arundo donax TaxID=35708 RepID=A0A0A8YVU6_ARUDO